MIKNILILVTYLVITAFTATLTGCQNSGDIQDSVQRNSIEPSPRDTESLIVYPVIGMADLTIADRFAAAIASALRQKEIAATIRPGGTNSLHLIGRVKKQARSDVEMTYSLIAFPSEKITIRWVVIDSSEQIKADYTQTLTLDPRPWARADETLFAIIAKQTASALTERLTDLHESSIIASAHLEVAAQEQRLVGIAPVTGAPGNGNRALTRALQFALEARSIRTQKIDRSTETSVDRTEEKPSELKEEVQRPDFIVEGQVQTEPVALNWENISIGWILRTNKGEEIARLDQANKIPTGSLDGNWGEMAAIIAHGAALGLEKFLDHYKKSQAQQALPSTRRKYLEIPR